MTRAVVIPKRFSVFGSAYNVRFDPSLVDREEVAGAVHLPANEILLQPSGEQYPTTLPELEQTFFHEVFHIIARELCEDAFFENERLVELFSKCLHQVLVTGEGDLLQEGDETK